MYIGGIIPNMLEKKKPSAAPGEAGITPDAFDGNLEKAQSDRIAQFDQDHKNHYPPEHVSETDHELFNLATLEQRVGSSVPQNLSECWSKAEQLTGLKVDLGENTAILNVVSSGLRIIYQRQIVARVPEKKDEAFERYLEICESLYELESVKNEANSIAWTSGTSVDAVRIIKSKVETLPEQTRQLVQQFRSTFPLNTNDHRGNTGGIPEWWTKDILDYGEAGNWVTLRLGFNNWAIAVASDIFDSNTWKGFLQKVAVFEKMPTDVAWGEDEFEAELADGLGANSNSSPQQHRRRINRTMRQREQY